MCDSKFFTVTQSDPTIPILVHIPHSSDLIPQEFITDYCISAEALAEEQRLLVDWHTERLAEPLLNMGACAVQANFSRFFVDPERYADDSQEIMAKVGMGVLYERGCNGERIRKQVDSSRRTEILDLIYYPYHDALYQLTKEISKKFGYCVIVDMHSYPQKTLAYEVHKTAVRPEFCLGTDSSHSSKIVVERIQELVLAKGYSFAIDQPFVGTYIPLSLYKDRRIFSYMFEIRRDTYMDELTSKLIFDKFQRIQLCIQEIGEELISLGAVN